MDTFNEKEIEKYSHILREEGIKLFGSVEKYEKFLDKWNSIGCQSFSNFPNHTKESE